MTRTLPGRIILSMTANQDTKADLRYTVERLPLGGYQVVDTKTGNGLGTYQSSEIAAVKAAHLNAAQGDCDVL